MNELFESANDMLLDRSEWEQRARIYVTMRHFGLPRRNLPFPTAANGHVSVIDKAIRKQKPFWAGQVLSGDRLCVFTSMKDQFEALTDSAADYYDFQTRNYSLMLDEAETMMDFMLLTGRGIMKCTVDPLNEYKLIDEAIDPMFFIMPWSANDIDDADEFVHVRQMTVAGYKRLDDRWDKSPETIKRIRGNQDWQSLGVYTDQKQLREGINYTRKENQILIFEHWVKTSVGHDVHTYCPMAPDIQLRKTYQNPYKIGNKPSCPFFSFQMEIKDKGWYSPRGLGDLLAAWEQYETKLLNEKADAITFANRPLYTGEKEIMNMANFRWQPGEYIPGNIRGVQQGVPPISFDKEIEYAKSESEAISQSPDFGIVQGGPSGGDARTATENNRIAANQQAGTVYNGQMYRRRWTKMHQHRWALMVQYKSRSFAYYAAGQTNTLEDQALHNEYLIMPDGSPDAWNPLARFQKSVVGMQTFAGNPNVNMEVLTKRALTDYDGRLALKAFIPSNEHGQDEYMDQVLMIGIMAPPPGYPSHPVPAKVEQDHVSRIKASIDWIQAAQQMQTPVDPIARQRIQQNLGEHIQLLKKQNPDAGKQIEQMLMGLDQSGQQAPQEQAQLQ